MKLASVVGTRPNFIKKMDIFAQEMGKKQGEEMVLDYTNNGISVKIEIQDASKTVIDFLESILSQKPLAKAVSY